MADSFCSLSKKNKRCLLFNSPSADVLRGRLPEANVLKRNRKTDTRLHDQAGSTSLLYVSWTSQLDVCLMLAGCLLDVCSMSARCLLEQTARCLLCFIPRLHDRANIKQLSKKTSSKYEACIKHSKHWADIEQTSSKHRVARSANI